MRARADMRPPPATSSSDGDQYEVESILAKRGKGARTEYLVRWKEWPIWEATWERRKNLEGAVEILDAFESNLQVNLLDTMESKQQPQWDPHPASAPQSEQVRFNSRRAQSPQSATSTGSAVSNRLRAEARDKSRFSILDRRSWSRNRAGSKVLKTEAMAQAGNDQVLPPDSTYLETKSTPPPVPASRIALRVNSMNTKPTSARRSGPMQPSPTQGCAVQLPRVGPGHTGSRR